MSTVLFVKNVSATAAAKAMGGFSEPYLHTHAEAPLMKEKVEAAVEKGFWWTHTDSFGGRILNISSAPAIKIEDNPYGYWVGYHPNAVRGAEYTSASSGSVLRWICKGRGWGELTFIPPVDNPDYRGAYFEAWARANDRDFVAPPGTELVYATGFPVTVVTG